jgi:hypothetical protein
MFILIIFVECIRSESMECSHTVVSIIKRSILLSARVVHTRL